MKFENNTKLELKYIKDKEKITSLNNSKIEIISHYKTIPKYLYNYDTLKKINASFEQAGDWTGVIFAAYSIFAALFSSLITLFILLL